MDKNIPMRIYLNARNISENVLDRLTDKHLLAFDTQRVWFPMRDFIGNTKGYKCRNMFGYLKETNVKDSNMGYLFVDEFLDQEFRPEDMIFICEGLPDFLTLAEHSVNVIGLPSINQLKKCIKDFHKQNPNCPARICLLTDTDKAGDMAVENMRRCSDIDLQNVFDCRGYLTQYKDINDLAMAGAKIDIDQIFAHAKQVDYAKEMAEFLSINKTQPCSRK